MKNLILFSLSLSLLSPNLLIAQELIETDQLEIHLGPLHKRKSVTNGIGLFLAASEYNLAIRDYYSSIFHNQGFRYAIEVFDKDYNLLQSSEDYFTTKDLEGDEEIAIAHYENALAVLSQSRDKRSHSDAVFIQKIDPKTLEPNEEFVKLVQIEDAQFEDLGHGVFKYRNTSNGAYRALIYAYPKGFVSKQVKVFLFDSNWDLVYEKVQVFPFRADLTDLLQWNINQEGVIHFLYKEYDRKREENFQGKPNYSLQLVTLENDSSEARIQELEFDTYFLSHTKMKLASNGDVYIAATATDEISNAPLRMFCSRIRPSKDSILYASYGEIPLDSIAKDLTVGVSEVPGYDSPEIEIGPDGSVFVLSERKTRIKLTKDVQRPHMRYDEISYEHRYYGIIVSHFDPSGNSDWSDFIFKKQETSGDAVRYSSFYSTVYNGKLHVFFAGPDRHTKIIPGRPMWYLSNVSYTAQGQRNWEIMYNAKEKKRVPKFIYGVTKGSGHIVFPADYRSRSAYIELRIK
ncbi:hypothetical protein [Croceimicrobium hydrocarbonivorans]|uniref:Uncharacterized protein n=1 Tax=Croceimicrobium hydrocarbonivorans TaxID=2761580 RepID=A0A7H0VGR0_9FLAO|nr:hypothetical protein [Croceimicrobium hydrocarbonivorans]QNR24908.1 hypothetical protein H4K34_03440 [Croceimicrobium hydrocarbonivorans]